MMTIASPSDASKRFCRIAQMMLAAASLTGCSSLDNLRTDLSAKPPVTGVEETALINNLFAAYENCSAGKCERVRTSGDQREILNVVDAGMTLSDFYCDAFFRRTNQAARKRRFARGASNDVGGAIAAVLGLARAGSALTGGAAAGFSFLDSEYRNYDESFLVDADLSKLRRLVMSAEDNMKKAIYAAPPSSFFAAESTILRYAGLCSFLGMQDLLNESVQEKTSRIEAANSETPMTSSSTPEAPPPPPNSADGPR